jgi:hypothetical protein
MQKSKSWMWVLCLVGTLLIAALTGQAKGASKPPATSDLPVTTYLSDTDNTGTLYYLQSDVQGAYKNGVNGATSILVANGYNGIVDGDWRLDLSSSTVRTVGITFNTTNAVQPGDSGYQAPANPPYWGTGYEAAHMENKCTQDNHNMLTMKVGDSFPCVMIIRLPGPSSGYCRLYMGKTWYSETNDVQVTCNAANSSGCNDWFVDPIPVVNADGSTSPGKARARLNLDVRNKTADDGDFYLTFHIHVTRP